MTQAAIATKSLFQTRDLFVHDGNHLRRLRLSAPVQMAMLAVMALLFAWSAYSAIRLFIAPSTTPLAAAPAAVSSDIARLAAATEARVHQIEERQRILASMIAGEKIDPEVIAKLGYVDAIGQGAQGGPFDSASQADPTFKSLFTSWKKLDNLADGAIAVKQLVVLRKKAAEGNGEASAGRKLVLVLDERPDIVDDLALFKQRHRAPP